MRISDETIARWYAGIQQNDAEAISDFYENLLRTFGRDRFLFVNSPYGDTIRDVLHDSFIDIVENVRAGRVREPGALLGIAKTIIRFTGIQNVQRVRKLRETRCSLPVYLPVTKQSIEKYLIDEETSVNLRAGLDQRLAELAPLDREILQRFYLQGQDREQICREMSLTFGQYRNIKHRAKNLLQLGSKEKPKEHARSHAAAA